MRYLFLVLLLLSSGCIAVHNPDNDIPDDVGPKISISAATKQARYNYEEKVADMYLELAANPPETVTEAGMLAAEKDAKFYKQFLTDMADIMAPEIGDEKLDKEKAKKLFTGIADGFRPPKKRK